MFPQTVPSVQLKISPSAPAFFLTQLSFSVIPKLGMQGLLCVTRISLPPPFYNQQPTSGFWSPALGIAAWG